MRRVIFCLLTCDKKNLHLSCNTRFYDTYSRKCSKAYHDNLNHMIYKQFLGDNYLADIVFQFHFCQLHFSQSQLFSRISKYHAVIFVFTLP